LTGVPMQTVQSLVSLQLLHYVGIDWSHYYTSEIALNDSNTVVSEASVVSNITLSFLWRTSFFKADLGFAVANLYNREYSLGHDINAFGSRFYNPAAKRNISAGIRFRF